MQSDLQQHPTNNKKKTGFFSKFFEKIEERETPPQVYNWRIYFTALIASAGAIIIGYDGGFIGGTVALKSFKKEFDLGPHNPNTDNIIANVISLFHIGAFAGSLVSYLVSHFYGRRLSLLFASILITIGSAIMLAANGDRGLGPVIAGRVLSGIAVGFSTNLTVVYLSEISPPAIRGQLTAGYEIGWRIGDLTGFWIAYGVSSTLPESRKQWMIPFAVQLIPSAMFMAGSFFMKESPRWLFQVGRDEEATRNLCWLRQLPEDHEYIQFEIEQVKGAVEYQKSTIGLGIWDPVKEVCIENRKLGKRLLTTVCLFWIQNFLGIQSINYYSPRIFAGLGIKGTNATLFSTGMFGVVKFIFTNIYIFFIVDHYGRRKSFIVCSSICAIAFFYIGSFLKLVDPTDPASNGGGAAGRGAIAMMYIWIAGFITAWSGGPYVVGTEFFDQNLRSFVQAMNAASNWLPTFILARWTTNMIKAMQFGIYFFYAGIAMLSIPYVFFFIPESKGIALEDIDKLFAPGLPAWRAHAVVMEEVKREKNLQLVSTKISDLEDKPVTEHRE